MWSAVSIALLLFVHVAISFKFSLFPGFVDVDSDNLPSVDLFRVRRDVDESDLGGSGFMIDDDPLAGSNVSEGTCDFVSRCWSSCAIDPTAVAKGNKGNQGATGPQGFRGYQGDPGAKGEKGAIGAEGDSGEIGENGQQGAKGEKGRQGQKGSRGVDAVGEKGEKGDKGAPGEVGDQGRQGCKGQKGEIGPVGEEGDVGFIGQSGPIGQTGQAGDKGDLGPFGWPGQEAGERGETGDKGVMGPKGIIGGPGGAGEKGAKGNPGPLGEVGDPGICSDAEIVGNSETMTHGPRGDKGEKGKQGENGYPGLTGRRGDNGESKQCDLDETSVEYIKGMTGRPGSKPPLVKGDKGDSGNNTVCGCDDLKCPENVTVTCKPDNVTVECKYNFEEAIARPGARGQRGPEGERGPPGTDPGEQGEAGDEGPMGRCEKCDKSQDKETIVRTSPGIYVLHEMMLSDGNKRRVRRQAGETLGCALEGHTPLWRGISYAGAVVDNVDALHDFGGTGSCLAYEAAPEQTVVSFTNVVEVPSSLTQMRAQLVRSSSQKAFWLANTKNQNPSRCVVCRSQGPVSVFHGSQECPETDKKGVTWKTLWKGSSLAMIAGDYGNYRRGLKLDSPASCVPRVGFVGNDAKSENLASFWMSLSGSSGADDSSPCVVCSLEPKADAKHEPKADGSVFVQHSQVGAETGCRAGHTELYSGYSLLSASGGGEMSSCSSSFVPLVTARSCVKSKYSDQRMFCQPNIQSSVWMLTDDYVPNLVDRAVVQRFFSSSSGRGHRRDYRRRISVSPAQMDFLLTRKHNFTDVDVFKRNYVSRCSVCLSRGPVYVRHGIQATLANTSNLTCATGFTKLWDGYSFVMATVGGSDDQVVAKNLNSPDSCLRSFEPIMALDCQASLGSTATLHHGRTTITPISSLCNFPFTAHRVSPSATKNIVKSHWLANPNGPASANHRLETSYAKRYSHLVSRCVVCEMNLF